MSQSDTYKWIQKLGVCASIRKKDIRAHTYFMKLFQERYVPDEEHPDKLVGLIDFKIVRQPLTQTLFEMGEISKESVKLEMGIIKEDGTEDSISWLNCYKGPLTHREKLISACKIAIHTHPIELERGSDTFRCVDTFLEIEPIVPTKFAKNTFHQYIFREDDAEFRERWKKYYTEHTRRPCPRCSPMTPDEEGWMTVR